MEVPGCSKPSHQYGSWVSDVAEALSGTEFTVLPDAEGVIGRELDETEIRELEIWKKNGFNGRTEESTT